MYNLVFITNMVFMGTYADLPSCQEAIREIYAQKLNPAGKRVPELEESINFLTKIQKSYLCIPVKKD